MIEYINNVLSNEDITNILTLPEVVNAKNMIDLKTSGSIYFNITLTETIKNLIYQKIGLNLFNKQIPMRWIKGDTLPHIDKGINTFNNTYLIYLTNSSGEFIINDSNYPIIQGSAYIFNEGIYHETINTGNEPRLLLGPMSETGFAVGAPVSISGDGNTTIYIRQNGIFQEYSNDQSSWNYLSWPCIIQNSNTSLGLLKIDFITDITIITDFSYFVCYSSHIQFGNTTLKQNGTRPIITIDNVSYYSGLIQNGTVITNGYDNIYVFNIEVNSTNGSTLYASEGGWIGQQYFGKGINNNYIINCSSNGPISDFCGGIVGPYSGSESGSELIIIGCSSSGALGTSSGGIFGYSCGTNNGAIKCISCWSTAANISGENAGGIIGDNANNALVENCYTTGNISGENAGGIVGGSPGNINSVTINNCYSTGNIIGYASGGIIGAFGNYVTINNCYTTGNVVDTTYNPPGTNNSNGAICGFHNPVNNIQINNCYTCGNVDNNGYFNGKDQNDYSVTISNSFSEDLSGIPGTWNSTNANTVLTGLPDPIVGIVWVSSVSNQPYELKNMGYTPYSTTNITFINDENNSRVIPTLIRSYLTIGDEPEKDMDNQNYTGQFNPFNFQLEFFPNMADFIDGNIVAGDKNDSDRLNASYWNDLGNDVFDDWGYFYIYDVITGKYYFPLINPQNQDDEIITTQIFNAFGRVFTIKHGWIIRGVFKFDITVNDNLPFRFGAYGNMGSDGDEIFKNLTQAYTIAGTDRTLYYRFDAEGGDDKEILYTYFVPKNNSENNISPLDVYYNDDDMSMVSKELTTGLIVYFAKSYDVKDIVIKDLKYTANEGNPIILSRGSTTSSAIINGKFYTVLQKMKYNDDTNVYEVADLSNTITINTTTGIISTTSATEPGIYTIYIRNNGSYNITEIILVINDNINIEELDLDDMIITVEVLNRRINSRRDDFNIINHIAKMYSNRPNKLDVVKAFIKVNTKN